MFRLLLISLCLFSATNAVAQKGKTTTKTTEKQTDIEIDYKQIGAPLPPMRVILHQDTTHAQRLTNAQIEKNNASKSEAQLKKEARQKKEREKAESKGYLDSKDLDNGVNLFVMMFNPTCSHCQEAAILMGQHSELFDRTKVVMMANPMMQPYMNDFLVFSRCGNFPFMYLGIDSADNVNKLFLYRALPQINIYNEERKLIKIFNGDVAIDSLRQYIQ